MRILSIGNSFSQDAHRWLHSLAAAGNDNIDTYNLFLPEANNAGHFGEVLTEPIIGEPGTGAADTFLSAGEFSTRSEPENFNKYLKTKFLHIFLLLLK